jgi:O-antigen ligase
MFSSRRYNRSSRLTLYLGISGIGFGIVAGFVAGANPLLLGLAMVAIAVLVCFFTKFEQTVLGLLLLRSSLDPFSSQQIPAAFAIGVNALVLLYVIKCFLKGKAVHTDRFWWFFAGWVALQGLWIVLLPLGGLGLDSSYLPISIREWVRLFSWLMVYLLVMQLKGKVAPQKVVSSLFLALIVPVIVALMQMFIPSLLPPILLGGAEEHISISSEEVSRIRGTLGMANTFATFVLLFIGLNIWKLPQSKNRWFWLVLLGLLTVLFVSTKSLFSLVMFAVFILTLIAPKLNIVKLIGGVLLFTIIIGLFASTEFGQQRLISIANTPLLNPDMDISRAILLSQGDMNSFNWRLAQWTYLVKAWEQFPIFGYGLATSSYLTIFKNYAHNDYVRALAEGGIVGFSAFLIFLSAQFIRILQLFQQAPSGSIHRHLCLILLGIFLATIVGMITENIWSHTTLFLYWWTLLAVAGWNWNDSNISQNTTSANKYL